MSQYVLSSTPQSPQSPHSRHSCGLHYVAFFCYRNDNDHPKMDECGKWTIITHEEPQRSFIDMVEHAYDWTHGIFRNQAHLATAHLFDEHMRFVRDITPETLHALEMYEQEIYTHDIDYAQDGREAAKEYTTCKEREFKDALLASDSNHRAFIDACKRGAQWASEEHALNHAPLRAKPINQS